jgi:hypothetical protein
MKPNTPFLRVRLGVVLIFFAGVLGSTGCRSWLIKTSPEAISEQSNPLAGWSLCPSQDPDILDKAVVNDYQSFIQRFKGINAIGPIHLFEDGKGKHAVGFEVFERDKNASWQYAITYDVANRRIAVVKYGYRKYMS